MIKKIYLAILFLASLLQVKAVDVTTTAGNLANAVSDHSIASLTITGTLDARDFLFIYNELTELKNLDLSNVTIAAYTSSLNDGTLAGEYSYNENTLPYCAFIGNIKLETVALPTNLQVIDYGAFAGCSSLKSITFPSTLTAIGDDAFNSCRTLSSLTIVKKIGLVGSKAFAHCEKLKNVSINPSVNITIGDEAFADCKALSTLKIGANVTSIGDGAFSYCTALKSIIILDGSKLEDIGDKAFYMSGLESIDFQKTPRLNHLGAWSLAKTNLKEINLPSHIKRLDEGTLFYNTSLNNLVVSKAMTYLPDYMLAGCNNLKNTDYITQYLGNIGDYALYNQSQHKSITMPYQVYYIGTKAMAGMTGLHEITSKPMQVPELGDEVWAGLNQGNIKLNVDSKSLNDYRNAEQWMDFLVVASQVRGDVNNDGIVNTADASSERRYIVDGDTQGINLNRTDVNGDGTVDVADMVSIYNILSGNEPQDTPQRYRAYDTLEGNGKTTSSTTATLDINLENEINYTAFQFNIVTPSHITINDAILSGRCFGHDIYLKQENANTYKVVCYSPAGDDIDGYSGVLLTLDITSTKTITSSDKISLSNTIFVDYQENVYRLPDRDLDIIGISAIDNITADEEDKPVNVYNTQGQLLRSNVLPSEATQGLPSGIYIVGNKKVIVR